MNTAIHEIPVRRETLSNAKTVTDKLIKVLLPVSIKKHSFIINDLSRDLTLPVNENLLSLVIGNLMKEILSHTQNECLRVENNDKGTICFKVKSGKLEFNRPFMIFLDNLKVISRQMGGDIYVAEIQEPGTELSVNFLVPALN